MKLNECLRVYAWALICTFRENMPRKYHSTLGATIITTKINTDISGSGNFKFRCLVFGQFFPCKQTNCLQPRLIFRFEHCLYNGISSLLLTYTNYLLFICLFVSSISSSCIVLSTTISKLACVRVCVFVSILLA